jgi:hypothetical protein
MMEFFKTMLPLTGQFWTSVNVVFGAGLGASFYILVKTQPYLVNRSYDPKFNASYISRFITGVIGGVILAIALGPFLTAKLGNDLGKSITPGILALLGGFSAEAVELILQRMVDVLLAAVRGDGSAAVQAKAGAAAEAKTTKVEAALDNAIDAHDDPKAPAAQVKDALKKVREELAKPSPPAPPET